jgi:hypothetical protein
MAWLAKPAKARKTMARAGVATGCGVDINGSMPCFGPSA